MYNEEIQKTVDVLSNTIEHIFKTKVKGKGASFNRSVKREINNALERIQSHCEKYISTHDHVDIDPYSMAISHIEFIITDLTGDLPSGDKHIIFYHSFYIMVLNDLKSQSTTK